MSKDILLGAFYTATKAGKTGLTPTMTVKTVTLAGGVVATLVSAQAMVEVGLGLYIYRVAAADLQTYYYLGVAHTADATVDFQDLAAAQLDFADELTQLTAQGYTTARAGFLDALNGIVAAIWAAATRTLSAFGFTPTVGGYAAGQDPATLVLDTAAAGHNTAATIGAKINASGASGDPLMNVVPGAYASGSAGYALGKLGSGALSVTVLVPANAANIPLVVGADYFAVDGLSIDIRDTTNVWPSLAGATIQLRSTVLHVTGSIVGAGGANQIARFEPTATLTGAIAAPGAFAYEAWVTLASGHTYVLFSGLLNVTAKIA